MEAVAPFVIATATTDFVSVAGAAWYTARYCAVSVRYGYRQGARKQRVSPPE